MVEPSVFCVGGVHETTAVPFDWPTTLSVNGARLALTRPSLTVIVMFEYEPTLPAAGVPVIAPLVLLNVAQAGRFVTLNASVLPSGSDADGVKVYDWPTVAPVPGVPPMTGGRFAA